MNSSHALLALALAASGSAQAFSCAPTGGQECRLELSTLTVVFDSGVYSFDGDSQLNGSDGYVQGYTVGAGQFPELNPIDQNGGQHAGFSFGPAMYAQVGGSGINGNHEASASFGFYGLQFIARPGYKIDTIEFGIGGGLTQVGNGWVALEVPGSPQFMGDMFTSSALYALGTQQYRASFAISASYEEGEDGTAASYGTASVFFDSARLVAHISAVPEPGISALMIAGLGAVGFVARRRKELR